MSTQPTLYDRFADLAEDAPAGPMPTGIWVDGRRRARTLRVGTALLAAVTVVALAAVGGYAAHRADSAGYAAQSGAVPALPRQIHHPSPWLAGTGGHPPGRLSVLLPGKRGGLLTPYHWGMVGVSATTGEYRYLEIPGCLSAEGLSRDGQHVWCFAGSGSGESQVIDGLAIYDTGTGHVDRWDSSSGKLGLNSVAWDGNAAVTFRAGGTSYLWRFGHGDPHRLATDLGFTAGTTRTGGLYLSGRNGFLYFEPARDDRPTAIALDGAERTTTPAALSPSGHRIAVTRAGDSSPSLMVGDVAAGGLTSLTEVPATLNWPLVVGWADEQHLAVVNQVSPVGPDSVDDPHARYVLDRVDVDTGQVVQVAGLSDEQTSRGAIFASSLLGAPTRAFPAPPTPVNHRLEAGLVAAILLLGGLGLVVWRLRVRS